MTTLRENPQTGEAFEAAVRQILEPFNVAGLCDPARRNMYPYTGY